jgi:AcrR family transcriptional regulator
MTVHKSESRLRQRLRETTHAVILEAAEGVLAREGTRAARMEDIASAAGIAVGTLYNYFADRDTLVAALFDSRRDELLDAIDAALVASRASSFEARLEAFLLASFGHFEAHRSLFTLALEDDLNSVRCGPKRSWAQKFKQRLETIVNQGIAEGTLRSDNAELLPAMILGLTRGTVMHAISRGGALPDLVKPVIQLLLHGAGRK